MMPDAAIVAFSGSVSNHWSRKSAALIVISWTNTDCCCSGSFRNRRASPTSGIDPQEFIRAYEKGKPFQHPIGYATLGEQPNDAILYDSDADWIAPWARISPARPSGTGSPSTKVIINDSDHSYYRMWNDTPQQNRNYIWENFANGSQVLFMDPYLVYYPREKRNLCASPVNGIGSTLNTKFSSIASTLR